MSTRTERQQQARARRAAHAATVKPLPDDLHSRQRLREQREARSPALREQRATEKAAAKSTAIPTRLAALEAQVAVLEASAPGRVKR